VNTIYIYHNRKEKTYNSDTIVHQLLLPLRFRTENLAEEPYF